MLESEEHGQETVFDRYKSVNFNSLSRDFQIHIRALALWVMEKGGLPFARSRTFHGVDVGGWLYERCLCPHAMSEVERTVLRCVPGVLINSAYAPVSRHDFMLEPSRVQLWRRLKHGQSMVWSPRTRTNHTVWKTRTCLTMTRRPPTRRAADESR